ncbi:hypothetical protein Csa_008395 [Cucumis sativus]|uniref:Uncharacterized protein n=1 Tax=Cucumis sativus TaxID=3659 RepID=A0A0A0KRL8_CUCSA|nr:hypothetical protein Csa_008395 [Cucumis sativus]
MEYARTTTCCSVWCYSSEDSTRNIKRRQDGTSHTTLIGEDEMLDFKAEGCSRLRLHPRWLN